MTTTTRTFESLKPRLDAAVGAGSPQAITRAIKDALEEASRDGLELPARFHEPLPDTYARRLLYRDPRGQYVAVVMTWGPGQGTLLHDHAGIWCVECVVDGEMEVTQYDLLPEGDAGACCFQPRGRVRAARGAAGCLIPPFEYHTLSNALPDRPSVTLHVYGGDLVACHIFEPQADGTWRRATRQLTYHD
jgi:3-mercaptopropionate dioxygenase